MSELRYEPLTGPSAFRILMVHRGQGQEPIVTHLINASLDVKWYYWTALSYTWGDPNDRVNITCNQRLLSITANLHSAIRRLRLVDAYFFLWVDALCINQEDVEEKAVQVALMQRIYSQANMVMVDLGDADADFDDVMKVWTALANVARTTPTDEAIHYSRYESLGLPDHFNLKWQAWRRFLERPWFGRVWTVQEYALAKNVIMMYGPERIGGDVLPWLVASMVNRNVFPNVITDHFAGRALQRPAQAHCAAMQNMQHIRHNLQAHEDQDLFSVLQKLALQSNATDKRDKVYGFLGLASAAQRSTLYVSYTEPTATVYYRTAKMFVEQDSGIDMLHQAAGCCYLEGLPSWAPNRGNERISLSLTETGGTTQPFAATLSSRPQIKISSDGKVLDVHGICLDTIEAMTAPATPLGNVKASNVPYLAQFRASWEFVHESRMLMQDQASLVRYGPERRTREAHWRTLVCDMKRDGSSQGYLTRPAPSGFQEIYEAWLKFFYEKPKTITKVYPFVHAMELMSHSKRFCVTNDGYVGLVPGRAERGDVICVFMGATVPFVIRRKTNGNFLLVGECYIHGLMDGEALDILLDKEELREQIISLE